MAVSGEEAPPSPRGRLKFLCSFGGRILPRPSDGQLKYVGGETRFVAFPRSVTFSEVRRKMGSVFNGEAVIKYQMASDDLDALVSVTCDEDLLHMLEEYDRHEARPSNCSCSHPARLRVFLFPPAPAAFDVQHHHPHPPHHLTPEQRYIDAVNGVSRPPPAAASALRIPTFTLSSSAESSPTSTSELVGHDAPAMLWWGGGARRGAGAGTGGRALQEFHRVHSSPNLHSPGHRQQQQPSQGWRMPGHHHPPPHHHPAGRRYYNSPTATATRDESGACACCGHVEE